MIEEWRAGTLTLALEQEARGRALALAEVATVELPAILHFYGVEGKR